MQSHDAPPGRPDKLRESLASLPHVGDANELLSSKAAMAAFFDLINMRSRLPKRIQHQVDEVLRSAITEIESVPGKSDVYSMTELELRGLLARALIVGGMQAAYDIGRSKLEAQSIYALLIDRPSRTIGDGSDGGEGPRPAA